MIVQLATSLWLSAPAATVAAAPPEASPGVSQRESAQPSAGPPVAPARPISVAPSPLAPRWEAALIADREVVPGVNFRQGKGLEIATADGRFSFTPNVFSQLLYTYRNEQTPAERHVEAFEVRRARIMLSGNLFGKHNKYNFQFSVAPREIGVGPDLELRHAPVLNAMMMFDYLRDLTVVVGQYKVPYNRQRMNLITSLNMVDRAMSNFEFTFDRDVGVEIRSADFRGWQKLRYYAGIYGGHGFDNFVPHKPGLLYVGRVEVLPFGLFDDNVEGDVTRSLKPRLSLGAAYAFHDNATTNGGGLQVAPQDGGTTDYHNATADLMFKIAGVSLQGAFYYRQGHRNPGALVDPTTNMPFAVTAARNGLGGFAQLGVLIPRAPVELVGRYGQIKGLGTTSLNDSHELGGGLNVYVVRHSLKVQLDYFRLWQRDLRDDGNDQVRVQLVFSM